MFKKILRSLKITKYIVHHIIYIIHLRPIKISSSLHIYIYMLDAYGYQSHEICTYIFYHLISTSQTNIYIFLNENSSYFLSLNIYVSNHLRERSYTYM